MTPPKFNPRFPDAEIRTWASQYDYPGELELIAGPVAAAKRRGWLKYDEFVAIAEWKSSRPRKQIAGNAPDLVREITTIAFSPKTSPRLSIEILTILDGVAWPTASVFLHFCHPEPYPILDYRALWSLSVDVPSQYTFPFWEAYVEYTRRMARKARVDMRTLDRALWKYSELHQPAA